MIKLDLEPLMKKYSYEDVLDLCAQGITGNQPLKQKVVDEQAKLLPLEKQYQDTATKSQLFSIQPLNIKVTSNPNVIGNLKKEDLEKLYAQYFAAEGKPARDVYDAIKNAAKESCPFCGGIGTPATVDHFLPKAHFPQFAVLPSNLIPACRDCNMGSKKHGFAKTEDEQIIHPYFEDKRFFDKQWIFATYTDEATDETGNVPGFFRYFVKPLDDWSEIDNKRVEKYFEDFNLATRYATQASKNLQGVLAQIKQNIEKNVPIKEIIEDLLKPVLEKCPFVNHWQYGMYQGLIEFLTKKYSI